MPTRNASRDPADAGTMARFFKCALQVNPASYLEYRGQAQPLSEDEYNRQLLAHAQAAGIRVIGLADHGAVGTSATLRQLLTDNEIVVFPGFEIASTEQIHFVCLFPEDTTDDALNGHLGALGVDRAQPHAPVNQSADRIINHVNRAGGFIYAAHVTQSSGVLKQRLQHVWKNDGLLAAQIPGSVEDLRAVEGDFYRKVILNKNPDYRRERPMAIINACDVEHPERIADSNASCLIRMTRPCFASFRQAFVDPESRVRLNSDRQENHASAIEHVNIVGGYLDGLDIALSRHLNAVIGGRGTGKSTLLECLRFALDAAPLGAAARQQHEAIVRANLGAERGRVELRVRSAAMHGRVFTIRRRYGEPPVILDEQGSVSPHTPLDLLPGVALFGQNEIHELTRDTASRNRLIERFLGDEQEAHDRTFDQARTRLQENRASIVKAQQGKDDVEAEVEQLPRLEDRARQFRALGLDEKLKIIPLLETEKRLSRRSSDELERVANALDVLRDSLPDTAFLSDTALQPLPHAELLRQQRAALDQLAQAARTHLEPLRQAHQQALDALDIDQAALDAVITADEQAVEKAFASIPASQGKTGQQIGVEYQALLRQIEQIRPKQAQLATRQAQLDALRQQRKKLLADLSEAAAQRASAQRASVSRLNRRLQGKLRVQLQPEGNRQPLLDFLVRCNLEGVGPRRLEWVLGGDFAPLALADRTRAGAAALQQTGWGMTPSVVQGLLRLPEKTLLELEELVLPDTMAIELNVAHGDAEPRFRPIDELSSGQQCTAILHLLLLENQDPLILDQPEDNLDNAFIAERIVAELRRGKLSRQFLFATHNANIPVFGDAEWIGVLSVHDNKGVLPPGQQGAVDLPAIQQLAADILEGGREAFNQRRKKYGFE